MRHDLDSMSVETLHSLFAFENNKTEYMIHELEEFKKSYLPEPKKNWPEDEFRKRVWEYVVIDELEALLRLNPEMEFEDVLNEFLDEVIAIKENDDAPVEVFEMAVTMEDILLCLYEWFVHYCTTS